MEETGRPLTRLIFIWRVMMGDKIETGLNALDRHMKGNHIVGDYKKIKDALLYAKKRLNNLHSDEKRSITEYSQIKENEND